METPITANPQTATGLDVADGAAASAAAGPHLYHDLSWIWPWWADPDGDYRDYSNHVMDLLARAGVAEGSSLLVFACGGGTNTANLKRRFRVTGVDLSADMLAHARRLNPECEFVQGDMRTVALGRAFDAVFLDDGVGYMLTRADLLAVFRNAFRYLHAGGVMVVTADVLRETFRQNDTIVWPPFRTQGEREAEVVIVENTYDPDPADDTFETLMLFLVREGGRLRVENDLHRLGLFSAATWREAIAEAGFAVRDFGYEEGGRGYTTFIGVREA